MKNPRRWKIIQRGKADNGWYCYGLMINFTKCKNDKVYIKSSGKWIKWNKTIITIINNKRQEFYFIPFGREYKIMGLRDKFFRCENE